MRDALAVLVAALMIALPGNTGWSQTTSPWPDLTHPGKVQGGGKKDSAVIVGVEDYLLVADVPGATQNAVDWSVFLHKTRGVPLGQIKLLTNKDGTKEKITRALKEAANEVKAGGTLWFIFVGHGAASRDGLDGVLVGADVDQDSESIYARSLSRTKVTEMLGEGRQAHTLMLLDTCFSGRTSQNKPLARGLQPLVPVKKHSSEAKVTVFSAGSSDQFAGPLPGADRPAFSYLMLGALRGWADENGDGKVTAQEVRDYTRSNLKFLLIGKRSQTPEMTTQEPQRILSSGRGLEKGPDVLAIASRLKGSASSKSTSDQSGAWDVGEMTMAVVNFNSVPTGASVVVDGRLACQATPCSKSLGVGKHTVEMSGDCYVAQNKVIVVKQGGNNRLSLKLAEKPAGIEVLASDKAGNDLEAEVFIDGRKVGTTPGRFKVGVCANTVEVRMRGYEPFEESLSLKARKITKINALMEGGANHGRRATAMVRVPEGLFIRGSNDEDDEGPVKKIWIDEFWIDKYEVTVDEYRACVDAGECTAPSTTSLGCSGKRAKYNNWGKADRGNHPVNCVDWNQATTYCRWRGKKLPTEAQWEKAARGTDGRKYPWGDKEATCGTAVMDQGGDGCGVGTTWPVNSKLGGSSPSGAQNMAGNVWEWVQDKYDEGYYAKAPPRNPVNLNAGNFRVIRGGSFNNDDARFLRAADRGRLPPINAQFDFLGFRCAR